MKHNIVATMINDKEYVTVNQMAAITNRSGQTVYNLVKRGNSIRKMKSIKIGMSLLIPLSELEEFPFTLPGKNQHTKPYFYNKQGMIID